MPMEPIFFLVETLLFYSEADTLMEIIIASSGNQFLKQNLISASGNQLSV